MKKLYTFLFALLISVASFGQVIITEIADPNGSGASGSEARFVELYVIGPASVDFTGWELIRYTNANPASTSSIDLTSLGTLAPDTYVLIAANGASFQATYGFAADILASTGGPADSNGDDKIAITDDMGTIIDIFGTPGVDSNNQNNAMNFEDGRTERAATVTGPNATWTDTEWNTDNDQGFGDGARTAPGDFDPGQWIGDATSCPVALSAATYTCSTNTAGDNNDGVTINIPYTGSDAGITSVTSLTGTVGGDDPDSVADGTITITGLSEGDAWDITLNGGNCDGTIASGTVPAAECDPTPNTCFDLSGGPESFELVSIVTNSSGTGGAWENNAGSYEVNAFCGGGCNEPVDSWLVFGPLDMTGVTDLELIFDAVEAFSNTDLVVNYASSYSGCPTGTTWTAAQTLTGSGSYSIDLSAATGTAVYIGIAYTDDGGYSGWTLSNVSLGAFGNCPTLGAITPSDCVVCDVTLQTETFTCATNNPGADNDAVTVEIPYTGSDNTITSVTTTTGTVAGDDPASVADGTIQITGLSEGDAWNVTINGGGCDGTTVSGTIPSTNCDPQVLVINEIHSDPSNAPGEVGDANGDGTAVFNEDEFVEIYNTGVAAVDMTGYTLEDASVRHTFPNGTILQPNSFITVFGGGTPTGIPGQSQVADTGDLGLSNSGDTVTLKDDNGTVIDTYTYSGAEGGANQSIGRSPDFTGPFVLHTTIGTANALFSPGLENDDPTLSVTQFEAGSFSVYPNPTNTGFVNIRTNNNEAISVSVFDILGKEVVNQTVSNNRLNVSTLNAGVYIMKISQNETSITKKLVIK
ncbi:lamin tail domain-containing protein [Ichthyenterobacterium magnum]|uniref:Putative secreted protein (Por secretion system target) n=1 Tax=Ichthyenterobacterium magnum TaxID=1230530 RepID=A0A420DWA1_9FLAO|nr:lamin tail domain-containing protein [Ichthyenterobacterium magnum]RKE98502.1 putative secreted protein (Por secretion system target) [Ichthyenterobacterium magnum]